VEKAVDMLSGTKNHSIKNDKNPLISHILRQNLYKINSKNKRFYIFFYFFNLKWLTVVKVV
jgi:hypothetical protein